LEKLKIDKRVDFFIKENLIYLEELLDKERFSSLLNSVDILNVKGQSNTAIEFLIKIKEKY
jgi:hypothetical protein